MNETQVCSKCYGTGEVCYSSTNYGNCPACKGTGIEPRTEPSPEPEAAPDDDQTAWASIEASRKIARGHAEIKQELTRVAEDQNLRPHFFNRIGKSNMCADCDFRWTDPIHLVGEPRMYQSPASEAQAPAAPDGPIDHRRNCPAWTNAEGYEVNGEDCTCGKRWRIDIQTLHELKAAWEKRAYESEAEVASLREKLALAEHKGWNDAIEAVVKMFIEVFRWNKDSSIVDAIRALAKGEKG